LLNVRNQASHPYKTTGKINTTRRQRENVFTRIYAAMSAQNKHFIINFM
jgi:hypothetical protein